MKVWTYREMKEKVEEDLDLEDETFIKPNEMIGYFNEAMNEAESEIMLLNQDYLLTKYFMPVTVGQNRYQLPYNIYANKIRGVFYQNGSIIYEVVRYRRKGKFEEVILTDTFGLSDDYRYLLVNDVPGQAQLELHPTSRDLAVLAPVASIFAPMIMWYIRNCARIPRTGEYCNPEILATTQVNIGTDVITTFAGSATLGRVQQGLPGGFPGSIAYVTGDQVRFTLGPGGTLPSPLVVDTTYYVIQTGNGLIKLATSLQNALLGTAIDLTTTGTVYFQMQVAATTAIIDATLIDIPEFATFVMQWVKCRCFEKESDPRLAGAVDVLVGQKKQMVDTLVTGVEDDDDTIQKDMSFYFDFSASGGAY